MVLCMYTIYMICKHYIRYNVFISNPIPVFSVAKYVIVLTDGLSSDIKDTKLRSSELHNDGVIVVSIGVGSNVNHGELLDIASHRKYVFSLHTTDALHDILENAMTGCKGRHWFCDTRIVSISP